MVPELTKNRPKITLQPKNGPYKYGVLAAREEFRQPCHAPVSDRFDQSSTDPDQMPSGATDRSSKGVLATSCDGLFEEEEN